MRFGSVCSGIEAASTAWHPLGWKTVYVADIEPFPCAVMAHRIGAGRPMHMPDPNEIDLPVGYTDADTAKLRAKRDAHKGKEGSALTEAEVAALVPLEQRADRRANIKALDHVEWGADVPNFGDFTKVEAGAYPIDLLVGGTPCQAFSVAGARKSLDDARGNLSLEYVRLVHATESLRWAVWENVPGVLSTSDNAFGCFLGGLVGADVALEVPGGGTWPCAGMVSGPLGRAAWRVLDAQHFGVAQRRRRVFVVFCPRASGGDPSSILFERQGMPWDYPSSGEAREGTSAGFEAGAGGGGERAELAATLRAAGGGVSGKDCPEGRVVQTFDRQSSGSYGEDPLASTVAARDYKGPSDLIAHTLRAEGFDASEDGTGRGTPLVPVAIRTAQTGANGHGLSENLAHTLDQAQGQAIAFSAKDHGGDATVELSPTLRSGGHSDSHANGGVMPAIASAAAVRRLTPRECERLQGFPDDHTAIPWRGKPAADGPRYKAFGNSMAVPVMHWIGSRIAAFEAGTLDGWKWEPLRFARAESEASDAHAFDARQSDAIQYGNKTGPLDTDGTSIAVMTGE